MSRKVDRELIIRVLYVNELVKMPLTEILEDLDEVPSEFVVTSLNNILENQEKIDAVIESNLVDWKLNRLSFLDRAIIRLATYEMMFEINPFEVVINEAIELTKKYTDTEENKSKAFNNKVLDNIKKSLNGK